MAANRPTDWHVLDLDGDPVPGDPERVKQLAKKLHDFADDVGDALRDIKGMAGEDALLRWAGKSAEAFTSEFEDVPKNLKKLKKSYELAGDALSKYWPELEKAQDDSKRALEKGRDARHDLSSAKSKLSTADDWVQRASKKAEEYEKDGKKDVPPPDEKDVRAATRNATDAKDSQDKAQTAVDNAQSALDAAKKMAADAKKLREDAATACKKQLDEASDAGIQNRSWWEEGIDWVSDNWDTIVSVCKVVVAVLGIVAMIIGGPILGAIVLIAALVVLADTLAKYANGEASLWDVAFAALDCIPGMKGLTTLGGLAKGAKALAKGGLAGMKAGLGKGLNALRKGADNLVAKSKKGDGRCLGGDPIDMISGEMFMAETDVDLPGLLPLTLRRTHLSTYRWGNWFGPSWASTLDERLELDNVGALFATDDGMILAYPVPTPGTSVMPIEGPRWPMDWDGTPGAPIRITDPQTGRTRHFAPLAQAPATDEVFTLPLAAISDRNGHRIDFDRDKTGAPTAVRHSGGYHVHVDTESDRVTRLRLRNSEDGPEGTTLLRYGYSPEGHLTHIYNSSGLPFTLTYDDRARITSWTDRNNSWYRFAYDDHDRCIQGEGVGGFLNCTITYDTENRETHYTDSLGHTTVHRYNELFQLVSRTDPLGNTFHSEWDRHNHLLSRTDPLQQSTRYSYDSSGNIEQITRPDGSFSRAVYNELHLPLRIVEPGGAVWQHSYDRCGNRISTVDPTGNKTRFTYDESGRLVSVLDSQGRSQSVVCNRAGLPVKICDPLGHITIAERDAFGRTVSVSDALGHITQMNWTSEGRPTWRHFPDNSTESWEWDAEGNLRSHTDKIGNTNRHTSTHFDLPSCRTDPDGNRHTFEYDTELRLVSVTDPRGRTWSYTYDSAGRLIAEVDFDDRRTRYGHDAAGRLTSRINGAEQRIDYVLDSLGRTVKQSTDGSISATFTYDSSGELVQATNNDTVLTIERDHCGRPLAETVNGNTSRYGYDEFGRLNLRSTPSGVLSHWTYNTLGIPSSLRVGSDALEFSYDSIGREVQRRIANKSVLSQEWDEANRLSVQYLTVQEPRSDFSSPEPEQVAHRSYSYRADGFLTQIFEHGTGVQTFNLDHAGRAVAAISSVGEERYSYDSVGNLIRSQVPGQQDFENRFFSGSLLRHDARTHFEYDTQGRLVRKTRKLLNGKKLTWSLTWSAEDRLTSVRTPNDDQWEYVYDPLGRRIQKRRLSHAGEVLEETVFVWEGTRLVEEIREDGRARTWDYVPGTHQPLTQTESQAETDSEFYAIVSDVVGTPRELISTDGRITWRQRTSVWGIPTPQKHSEAAVDCPLRFPGQYYDAETELHYNYFRHYDPESARYISPDPLGLDPSPNHYSYVNNPYNWADPLGLAPTACTTTVYRRQTDHPDSHRLDVDTHGNVSIIGDEHLYLNMSGDITHSTAFRNGDGYIVAFDVPTSYVDRVRELALPQRMPRGMGLSPREWRHLRSERPEISDPHVSADLYGIPTNMLGELQGAIIPGSGRIIGGSN